MSGKPKRQKKGQDFIPIKSENSHGGVMKALCLNAAQAKATFAKTAASSSRAAQEKPAQAAETSVQHLESTRIENQNLAQATTQGSIITTSAITQEPSPQQTEQEKK